MDTVYIVFNKFGQVIAVYSSEEPANECVTANPTLSVEAWAVEI